MVVRRHPAPGAPSSIEPAARDKALGESLRALFEHVAEQPLPDDMLALVEELERRRRLGGSDVS